MARKTKIIRGYRQCPARPFHSISDIPDEKDVGYCKGLNGLVTFSNFRVAKKD